MMYRDDVHAPGSPPTLAVGTWYIDRSPAHEWREIGTRLCIRGIYDATVRVMDEDGDVRVVNRSIFESQMRAETARPKRHRGSEL